MAARIWDVRGYAVNPFERIQTEHGRTGSWVRGCLQSQAAVIKFLQRIHGQGGAGDASGLRLEQGSGAGFDRRSGEDGRSPVDPREKILHEALGESFRLVQAPEQQTAEDLHDSGRVERRERQELSFL